MLLGTLAALVIIMIVVGCLCTESVWGINVMSSGLSEPFPGHRWSFSFFPYRQLFLNVLVFNVWLLKRRGRCKTLLDFWARGLHWWGEMRQQLPTSLHLSSQAEIPLRAQILNIQGTESCLPTLAPTGCVRKLAELPAMLLVVVDG